MAAHPGPARAMAAPGQFKRSLPATGRWTRAAGHRPNRDWLRWLTELDAGQRARGLDLGDCCVPVLNSSNRLGRSPPNCTATLAQWYPACERRALQPYAALEAIAPYSMLPALIGRARQYFFVITSLPGSPGPPGRCGSTRWPPASACPRTAACTPPVARCGRGAVPA